MSEGRVHPLQTSSATGRSRVSSCSRSSQASSVLTERVKLVAEKAAMVAEVLYCKKVDREQGHSVGSSSNLAQPQIDHVAMKSSISIAGGSHEYKALPIVPVKVKEGAAARLLLHYSIAAQLRPGAVRVCSCLVPVRLSPRPSRSIDFGDVSETNGPE